VETLNSLANLAYNRPDLTWPVIREGRFSLEMRNCGHPLIHPGKRVDNSLTFNEEGQIYLVTGANMAGKSTLLRMVGVNMVLAMAGGPVCAEYLSLVPVFIHTSVRTNDSLGDNESYFYAELKKLAGIINRLELGDPLFIIIDEMLKGTNSRDKHAGSAALIRRLISMKTSGLVATHDVELGQLEAEYPDQLVTRCFEVIIDNGQLGFDYRLRPGVSKNLNATFLMQKMGIING
jgi:DNA mismatch repair ATPase MutS